MNIKYIKIKTFCLNIIIKSIMMNIKITFLKRLMFIFKKKFFFK